MPGVVTMELGLEEEVTATVLAEEQIPEQSELTQQIKVRPDTENKTTKQLQHEQKIAIALQ